MKCYNVTKYTTNKEKMQVTPPFLPLDKGRLGGVKMSTLSYSSIFK